MQRLLLLLSFAREKQFMFCLLFGIYLILAHGEGAEILCEETHENVYTTITAYKWNVNNIVKCQISSNQIMQSKLRANNKKKIPQIIIKLKVFFLLYVLYFCIFLTNKSMTYNWECLLVVNIVTICHLSIQQCFLVHYSLRFKFTTATVKAKQ